MKTTHVLLLSSLTVLVLGLRWISMTKTFLLDEAAASHELQVDITRLNKEWNESLILPAASSSAAAGSVLSIPNVTNQNTHDSPLDPTYHLQPRAIFYNIFIKAKFPSAGNNIVLEQLQQIQQARGHEHSTIHYTVIGGHLQGGDDQMCANNSSTTRCQFLGYYEEANEVVTLQAMYEYCVEHPDHHVTYLHDKGSFHPKNGVSTNRRIATKGALACLLDDEKHSTAKNHSSPCNVCAAEFLSHPHAHIPGNMFAAQCQYISQLVPPKDYEQSRRNLCHLIYRHGISAIQKVDTSFCSPPMPAIVSAEQRGSSNRRIEAAKKARRIKGAADGADVATGFGRYAMERWVVSHPRFHICSVFHNVSKKTFATGWEPWEAKSVDNVKQHKKMSPPEKRNLLFQIHEYAYSYGVLEARTNPAHFCQTYFSKIGPVCPGGVSSLFRAAWAAEQNNTSGSPNKTGTRII